MAKLVSRRSDLTGAQQVPGVYDRSSPPGGDRTRSSFDFREALDSRKIILCDLSKGAIGADNAMLLGSLIVMQEKLAALSRGDVPESERVPHLLFAEEAQNYIGDFESTLSETRKFNLAIAIATQAIDSLSRETATAIFTNAQT